jgi:hypothetical protein
MLGFDRAGAAVANGLKLGVCEWIKEEGAGDEKQRAKAANVHQLSIVGLWGGGICHLNVKWWKANGGAQS